MGNSCLSNEARKVDPSMKQMEIQSFLSDDEFESKPFYPEGFKRRRNRNLETSLCRSEEGSNYTLGKLISKEQGKKRTDNSRNSNLSHPLTPKTLATSARPQSNERFNRLQQLKIKQIAQKCENEVRRNFEANSFSKKNQEAIKKTVEILSQDFEEYQLKNIQRYDISEIRKFLIAHGWNPETSAKKITFDIQWRKKNLPIKTQQLLPLIRSQQIQFQGMDLEMNPCLLIKPNYIPIEQKGSFNFNIQNQKYQREYIALFVFLLESMLPKLVRSQRTNSKFSIILDLEHSNFRMDLLRGLKDLIQNHYPERLSKVYVVNINLESIDQKIKKKFEKPFYKQYVLLFDEDYKQNLLKFFDPQELSEDYGGQVQVLGEFHNMVDTDSLEEAMLNEFKKIYPQSPLGFNFSY